MKGLGTSKLHYAIVESGIPQYKIAKALHISAARLSEYANERRPVPRSHQARISLYFGVAPSKLFTPRRPNEVMVIPPDQAIG